MILSRIPHPVRKSFKDGKIFEFTQELMSALGLVHEGKIGIKDTALENFFLPFDDVNISLNGIYLNMKNIEVNQVGMNEHRYVSLFFPLRIFILTSPKEFQNAILTQLNSLPMVRSNNINDNNLCIYVQSILPGWNNGNLVKVSTINNDFKYLRNFKFAQHTLYIVDKRSGKFNELNLPEELITSTIVGTSAGVCSAFSELHDPKRKKFVTRVRKTVKSNKRGRKDKVFDKYIYLTPTEFEYLDSSNLPEQTSNLTADVSPRATHFRRAHFRTYKSDRYVNMQGKKQYISPTWVGESCKTINHKQYKVILDLEGFEDTILQQNVE